MTTPPTTIAEKLHALREQIPSHVTLVAVSKTKPMEMLAEALSAGQCDLGENRVQELVTKAEHFETSEVRWHHIGHLQTNKVKQIVPHAHLIHAVDSMRLLEEIDKRSAVVGKVSDVLIQVHIAQEAQKHGFQTDELESAFNAIAKAPFQHVRVRGLMGMATFTDDASQVGREFRVLRQAFDRWNPNDWDTCSMGMSGDWTIAIDEGSTLVRIGSAIFGSR